MKVSFYTLGCKVNQYETEVMRKKLLAHGYEDADRCETPDVIIVNSCTVTAESDRKTRQAVRRYRKNFPNAVIVLSGCMSQVNSETAKLLPEADIIIGNNNIDGLIDAINRYTKTKNQVLEVVGHTTCAPYSTEAANGFSERTRAYIKIEDGCERFCSYCIIPKARGPVRSRPLEDIKAEAQQLAKKGYKEIVLVGINLTAYGKDEPFDICDAVDAVCSVDGILRVRLGSLEPDHISNEMLRRFASQTKFCPQFHLSLQSGCDETLKRMNRHYDTAFYYDLVTRIRSIFKNSAITTDIMVGFAGETDEEFEKTLQFVRKVGFASAHIFMYSRRDGTVAAALKNQVSNSIKQERSRKMTALTDSLQTEFLEQFIGKEVDVLFEKTVDGFAEGYTENYSRVAVKTDENLTGMIVTTKIIAVNKDHCIGEINTQKKGRLI